VTTFLTILFLGKVIGFMGPMTDTGCIFVENNREIYAVPIAAAMTEKHPLTDVTFHCQPARPRIGEQR
jgi:hypothetical protein